MNKRQREKIYNEIVRASVLKFHVWPNREIPNELTAHGSVSGPDGDGVHFTIFIDSETTPCIHWHSAARPLRASVFSGNVNKHHGRKATTVCADWPTLIGELTAIAGVAEKGGLFAAGVPA